MKREAEPRCDVTTSTRPVTDPEDDGSDTICGFSCSDVALVLMMVVLMDHVHLLTKPQEIKTKSTLLFVSVVSSVGKLPFGG